MKKTILSAVLSMAALIAQAVSYVAIQGQYIDGSTNTQVIAGTNATVSVVPALSTNYYNLPNVANSTNEWLSIAVPQNNLLPYNYLGYYCTFTNTMTNSLIVRMAASIDNTRWVSNMFWFAVTNTASVVQVPLLTNNASLGYPFWALQQIENLGATNCAGLVFNFTIKAASP